ncbi:YggS family pyridoxal phosphate-dependent enzyme [Microlunatus aurantiacus]|uniref:Pyridoxal phosphate homeostasis protein n=1 Tax=Microlunatus aurantiacus TaxID=446786 RepID=A0ABP7CV86_9ACTN
MDIAENLAEVRRRVDVACAAAGRDPATVRLLPVSKTKPPPVIREAYDAGFRLFGENKVQEAVAKAAVFADVPDLRWAVIGHLQTNKAKQVAEVAAEFHALDSLRLAEALDRRLSALDRTLDVFVQVNSSGEDSKFGLPPDQVPTFAAELERFATLRVRGLMTLAVFSDDSALVGACFDRMRDLQARLQDTDGQPERWAELSMGMSGDYEQAIGYGATTVRVGQAIFGDRLDPNDYWPVSGR